MHFLLSAELLLGTASRSASSYGISLRNKTLKFLMSLIERKMIFGLDLAEGNFTLPPEEDPNKPVIEPLVKS